MWANDWPLDHLRPCGPFPNRDMVSQADLESDVSLAPRFSSCLVIRLLGINRFILFMVQRLCPERALFRASCTEEVKDPCESRRVARASRSLYAGTAASQAREVRAGRGWQGMAGDLSQLTPSKTSDATIPSLGEAVTRQEDVHLQLRHV